MNEEKLGEIQRDIRTLLINSATHAEELRGLKEKLYGQGQDDGDIPQVRHLILAINGQVSSNAKRITRLEIILAGIVVSASGGIVGLVKLL